jgi:hypothetical protein
VPPGPGVGVGVGVGPATLILVSVDPVDWQVLPSSKIAVAQTAEFPLAIAVTVVDNGELGGESETGLTVATLVS